MREASRHHTARTHGTARWALAAALAATTALVPPAILAAGGAAAQTVQPLPTQAAPSLGRVINGLVVLDDPVQVRPGGWTPTQGVDTSRAPIVAGNKSFADALQPFLGQSVSVESFNRLITATVLAARHAGYPVVDVVVPDATIAANTGAGNTLSLGTSSVRGDLILSAATLNQLAGTTLVVGGNLDLTAVGSSTLNGTAIVGQDLKGAAIAEGPLTVVGGINTPQLAQGLITPAFQSVANGTFALNQGILAAAVPNNGLVTVQLFGLLPDQSIAAVHGAAVQLNRSGNALGGTLTVTTGASFGQINLVQGDVNLAQSGVLAAGPAQGKLEILAHKGTSFGGANTLNAGAGSFVTLNNPGNNFNAGAQPLGVFLADVANTTIDGSSGLTIGGTLGGGLFTNTVHGNLSVGMTGGIDIASPVQAHTAGAGDTAVIELHSMNAAVNEDGTVGMLAAATLLGSAGTSASLGNVNTIGTLAGFATHNGDFLFADTVNLAVTGTVAATAGGASIATTGNITLAAPVSATGAANLQATGGSISDPTNTSTTNPRTDVTAATLTLGAGTGIGLAAVPLTIAAPLIAATTASGGIDILNNTHANPTTVTTLGATSGNIQFIQTGGGNLTINRATDAGGNITIDVRNADLTVTNAATQNGGNIVLGLGSPNNLTLNGTVTASGSLLGRALRNVSILGATLGSGTTTTLIVDDAFPAPPAIGSGSFIVNGGTITTHSGQELSLFLARRSQVTIGTAPFVLNGKPFDDDAAAKQAKDQKDPFVHFGVYFAPTVMPDAAPFTVFFKELLEPPPPDHFENEIPLPLLNNRSFPVAFGMLYQQGPVQNAGLAGAGPGVLIASLGTLPGYARISSFDVAPDVFSAINRPIFMDVENPKTEELLGYELRPALEARLQPAGAGALPGIEPAGGTAMSCSDLPALLPILDNPELAQNLRDLCARRLQAGTAGAEPRARPARFYRVQR